MVEDLSKASSPDIQSKKTVLVVEDDTSVQRLLVDILEEGEYGVITARFGREALLQAVQYHPDLVLLDLMLPDKDGNIVLQEMGQDEKLKKISVVVLSSYTQLLKPTHQVRGVIAKPFDIVELLEMIESALTPDTNSPPRIPSPFEKLLRDKFLNLEP